MKTVVIILILFLPHYIWGQATEFVVQSFQLDLNDLEANRNPVYDANDKKCALIKVRTDLSDITFSSNNGIVDQKKVLTEYWIYVSYDEKKLNIYKNGFLPLNFDIPVKLEESKVYTFYITTNKRYSIVIQTEPAEAKVFLDGLECTEPSIGNIIPGKHQLKIIKDGYMPITDTIEVGDGRIFFTYKMEKIELTLVTISSEPNGAAIIINGEFKGLTPKQLFLYSGDYILQITKEFYKGEKSEISISSTSENNFHFNLSLNISQIGVFSFPNDALIFIDGKKLIAKTQIEAGEHLLEIKRDNYYTERKIVNIKTGSDTVFTVALKPICGILQFTVNPISATAQLFKDEKLLNSWTGAKRLEDLQIGDYMLKVDAKKHRKVEKQIKIKENSTEEIFMDLAVERQIGRQGKFTAIGLSTVVPGLGQFYSGNKFRAGFYSLAGIGTGALALYYNMEFNKTLDNYSFSKTVYHNAITKEDVVAARRQMDGYYNDLGILDKKRQIFLFSCATIYGINLIDAIIFGKKKGAHNLGENIKDKIDIDAGGFYGGLGLQVKYYF